MSINLLKKTFTNSKCYVPNTLISSSLKKFYCTEIKNVETTTKSSSADMPVNIKNPFEKEPQKCILCQLNIQPDYKNVRLLSQFQSPYTGRIYGRHITGLCKSKQESVEREISRAQQSGFMPSYHKAPEFLKDPRLFDPERPIRPHKY